ncbi:leucine-rich repeat and guanylate kinase domain-containing protein isoform X1 [Triplophysa dalaica]|uniref:leucine-rich repeat and guanylate kinase domain-containing protein isoform X1 n=1 Tax=Triplophysa dalaica TaxID=1582913 RepID=UPI0024DFC1B4|nr:leucine-rich repeat and guanylate kinase domain-containing protein isoform X1 [Triplophysa dalaica]XP_056603423.1 leucine-rich repeat and guanylate kinase domain-containing protein isoform X1 [Triplophysa dalaica]
MTLSTNTTTMENDGELREEQVSKGLSNLGLSATGLQHTYLCLSVPGRDLKNVSVLCNYIHLQKLELPHNKIKDLSCVSHMPHLIVLDASHNQLTDFFGFQAPKNLKEVNFSHNKMSVMKDLSEYSSLSKLILDHNSFSAIRGLEKCERLSHLSLANNSISCISGLDHLPLRELCLSGNAIQKIENLQTLRKLQVLDLSCNRIQSLSGLQTLYLIGTINLQSNLISEIKEASHLHDLKLLRDLNLLKNPVQEKDDHRLAWIFLLQHLTLLDQQTVTAEEKVSSVNKYDPPLEVIAARDHMTNLLYQLMQPQVIFDSTLPSLDTPYPMLVLTGPQACGKRELAHKLCQEISEYFAYGACHTTRGPYYGEEDGLDYHFVTEDEFQTMIQTGKFVQTMRYGGHWYGLSRESIEQVAREGLACCVHMELEGVYSLKNSYFEPRYVLLIPTAVENYVCCLKARGFYSNAQMETAVSRIDLYAKINREKPGFFDNVISCDDRNEAYMTLKQLVKEYLGVEEPGGDSSSITPDNTSSNSTGELLAAETEKADLTDSYSKNYQNKIQARMTPKRTPAEMASHRREKLIREALKGKSPGAYADLFQRSGPTAQSSLASHSRPTAGPMRPVGLGGPELDELSSSEESRASSGLSMRSSAGVRSAESPARGSDVGSGLNIEPLDISLLGQERDSKGRMDSRLTPDAPRLGSERISPTLPSSPGRPGANTKPVLPPIPSGRKTNESGSKL